jgi:hypothetical protein
MATTELIGAPSVDPVAHPDSHQADHRNQRGEESAADMSPRRERHMARNDDTRVALERELSLVCDRARTGSDVLMFALLR